MVPSKADRHVTPGQRNIFLELPLSGGAILARFLSLHFPTLHKCHEGWLEGFLRLGPLMKTFKRYAMTWVQKAWVFFSLSQSSHMQQLFHGSDCYFTFICLHIRQGPPSRKKRYKSTVNSQRSPTRRSLWAGRTSLLRYVFSLPLWFHGLTTFLMRTPLFPYPCNEEFCCGCWEAKASIVFNPFLIYFPSCRSMWEEINTFTYAFIRNSLAVEQALSSTVYRSPRNTLILLSISNDQDPAGVPKLSHLEKLLIVWGVCMHVHLMFTDARIKQFSIKLNYAYYLYVRCHLV